MMIEELLVDRLAPAESLVDTVPEGDPGLAEFPAQVNLDSVKERGEIDQSGIEVLDQTAVLLHAFDHATKPAGRYFAPFADGQRAIPIDDRAAHHHHAL